MFLVSQYFVLMRTHTDDDDAMIHRAYSGRLLHTQAHTYILKITQSDKYFYNHDLRAKVLFYFQENLVMIILFVNVGKIIFITSNE